MQLNCVVAAFVESEWSSERASEQIHFRRSLAAPSGTAAAVDCVTPWEAWRNPQAVRRSTRRPKIARAM